MTLLAFILLFQAHLLSVFDNTKSVTFDEKYYDKILAITSQEGETINLKKHVIATVSKQLDAYHLNMLIAIFLTILWRCFILCSLL